MQDWEYIELMEDALTRISAIVQQEPGEASAQIRDILEEVKGE